MRRTGFTWRIRAITASRFFRWTGSLFASIGHAGTKLGELSYPYDVAVDAAGNIFVCEFGNSRIQVFDANCQPVEIIGGAGGKPGQFNNPEYCQGHRNPPQIYRVG